MAHSEIEEAREPLLGGSPLGPLLPDEVASPRRSLEKEASLGALQTAAPPPLSAKPRLGTVRACSVIVAVTLLLGLLAASLAYRMVDDNGWPPACRKSAAVALVSQHLIVIYQDLHSFSLTERRWKKLHPQAPKGHHRGVPEGAPGQPAARWKAGVVQMSEPQGMLVMAGDAVYNGTEYYAKDTWMLRLPRLEWQRANCSTDAPAPRRAHSLASVTAADGSSRVVVYGGRLHSGGLLSDVWLGSLSGTWPAISWRRLFNPSKAVPGSFPLPRKGHTGLVADVGGSHKLLVYGGRNNSHYFGDVWAFDLSKLVWEDLTPAPPAPTPWPRDHHGAAFSGGRLFVLGGRSGADHATAQPLRDVWSFDVAGRAWRQELERGLQPLPRFLFSSIQYRALNAADDRVLIFGGETGATCKANDVWVYSMAPGTGTGTGLWTELSPPAWSRRRCRAIYG
eukprot:scaffold3.g6293.t1